MTSNDSLIPAEWYAAAARDLKSAKTLLGDNDEVLAVAGMLLQQAVEKYLKGYLLSKGWRLVKTHDLGELLKSLIAYDKDFEEFTDTCLQITHFYFENRYPLRVSSPVVREDVEKLFEDADKLIARIQSRASSAE